MQLISLLALSLPLAAAFPHDRKGPCCKDLIKLPKWQVEDLHYYESRIWTTPAHQNSNGYVEFNLTNSAVNYVTECKASSSQLQDFFYGTQWYICTTPAGAPAGASATFRYDRPSGRVDVNQTWVCDGGVTFSAAGTATKKLDCKQDYYHNNNWTSPSSGFYETYNTDCKKVDVNLKPISLTALF